LVDWIRELLASGGEIKEKIKTQVGGSPPPAEMKLISGGVKLGFLRKYQGKVRETRKGRRNGDEHRRRTEGARDAGMKAITERSTSHR